ncbi:hypothetical protein [Sulfobacillus sp. hq2]|uniref:hypothetical protein n=1 Tax=Sulfobacillus TaxID=28033 RepID=UPI001FA88941|nr:hypothetical protein [Sulfobacillus sp. hq2]
MAGKIAIVIVSGWDQKAKVMSGLHVAKRIHEAKDANGIDAVEVFLFTGGVKLLENAEEEVVAMLVELREQGILMGACSNQAEAWQVENTAQEFGVQLEFARDAFSRYAREGFTVMTF